MMNYKYILSVLLVFAMSLSYGQRRNNTKHRAQKNRALSHRTAVVHKNMTKRNVVRTLNRGYKTYRFNNLNYYRSNGVYYRRIGNSYTIVRAPYNLRIKYLPLNSRRLIYRNQNYYYNHGVFYRPTSNGYLVVKAPLGIRLPVLPVGAKRCIVRNSVYYQYEDMYLQPISDEDAYLIVNNPFI